MTDLPTALPRWRPRWPKVSTLLVAGALALAMLMGAGLGLDIPIISAVLVVALIGVGLLALPRVATMAGLFAALVVAGLIELYAPQFAMLKWGLSGLGLAVAFSGVAHAALRPRPQLDLQSARPGLAPLGWLAALFGLILASSVRNSGNLPLVMAGMKGYIQVWGYILALAFLPYGINHMERLMRALIWIGLLQLPFALHQFLVLVPMRSTDALATKFVVAVDVVSGTFGGSAQGGGRSSTLALFEVIVVALCLAFWRKGKLTTLRLVVYCVAALFPLALNETKLVIVLIPITFAILFREEIRQRPLQTALGGIIVSLAMLLFLASYVLLPSADSQKSSSADGMWSETLSYNVGQRGYGSSMLNRTTVYPFWLQETAGHGLWTDALIGFGPGNTNTASVVARGTLAQTRYSNLGIGLTSYSSLLWELGIFGVIIVIGLLWSTFRLTRKLIIQYDGSVHSELLKAIEAAIFCLLIFLAHSNYFVFDLSFQAVLAVILGYVLRLSILARESTGDAGARASTQI